jgi:hypothetical protein
MYVYIYIFPYIYLPDDGLVEAQTRCRYGNVNNNTFKNI